MREYAASWRRAATPGICCPKYDCSCRGQATAAFLTEPLTQDAALIGTASLDL